jgi:hypothetical protein
VGSGASSGGGDSGGNDVPMLDAAALPLATSLHGPFCSLFSSDGSTDAADHSSKYSGVHNPVSEVGAGTLLTPVTAQIDLCVTMGNSTLNNIDLRKVTNDISYEPVYLSPSMQNKMLMPIVSQGMFGSLVQDTQETRDACDDDFVGSLCSSGTGSKFYPLHNGLFIRRSTRSNVLDANGLPRADEDATLKAMRRASRRNLDGDLCGKQLADRFLLPADNSQATQILSGMKNPNITAISSLADSICANRLEKLGFKLGSSEAAVNMSINILKKMELDRMTAINKSVCTSDSLSGEDSNLGLPGNGSDDETDKINVDVLDLLIKDVAEVDFDDVDLDTKICELRASTRKSKKHSKKPGGNKSKTKKYLNERHFLE